MKPQKTKGKQERLWTVSFVLIVLIAFLGNMNGNGVHNGVSLLVEQEGYAATVSGIITGCFCFAALFARFFAGSESDKRGRKPVIIWGALLVAAGCVIGMLSFNVYLMIPARVLMGVGFSLIVTCTAAAVADIVPKNRLGEGIGYQGLAFALGMGVGPLIATTTAAYGRVCMYGTFLALAVITVIFALVCRFKKPDGGGDDACGDGEDGKSAAYKGIANIEKEAGGRAVGNGGDIAQASVATPYAANAAALEHAEKQRQDECSNAALLENGEYANTVGEIQQGFGRRFVNTYVEPAAIPPAVITIFMMMAMAIYLSFMSLYAKTQGIQGAGWFFLIAAGCMVLIRLLCGKAFNYVHTNALLIPAFAVGIVGFVVPLAFDNLPALLVSGVCYGVFCGLGQPLLTTEALRRASAGRNGAASAMYYIGCDVGVGLGSFVWGATISTFGFSVTFVIASLVLVAGIILALALLKTRKNP